MDWEIASSDSSCTACGRHFENDEDYYSALYDSDEGFARRDYCCGCWQGPAAEAFSFWRTRCRLKSDPPKRFVGDDVLLDFFDRLSEARDPKRAQVYFIMGVLLLRKRLLKETARRREPTGTVWVLDCPRLEKSFEVRAEGLDEEEVSEVLAQIGQVLNVRLDAEDVPAEDIPAEAPED